MGTESDSIKEETKTQDNISLALGRTENIEEQQEHRQEGNQDNDSDNVESVMRVGEKQASIATANENIEEKLLEGQDDTCTAAVSPPQNEKKNNQHHDQYLEADESPLRTEEEGVVKLRGSYLGYLDDDNDDLESPPRRPQDNENDVFQEVQPLPPPPLLNSESSAAATSAAAAPTKPGAYLGAPGQRLRRRDDVISTTTFDDGLERQVSSTVVHQGEGNNTTLSSSNNHRTSNSNLAVATEVVDESGMMQAEVVDPEELEKKANEKKRIKRCIFMGLLLVGSVATAALFGTVFGYSTNDNEVESAPTMAPSTSPSFAPSGALDLLREELPEYTLASLENFDTPQWKAWDWLDNHPDLPGMDEWKKRQLFVLATLYYSMDGDDWPELIKENWLLYNEDECLWFDNALGEFNEATGAWEVINFYGGLTVCNELNQFQLLDLVDLELSGHRPFIPPEISLLTSLSVLSLPKNDIDGPLSDFLPSQLYDMPNLAHINLYTNSLNGQLPTEVGKMTNIAILELYENSLTGPLPREWGMTTNMRKLYLYSNSFTGWIPSEMGRMHGMEHLLLYDNNLTGRIPSELGMMKSVMDLSLHENALTGSIPTDLGLMGNASWLLLYKNYLTGVIPNEMMHMTNVREISIGVNYLSGSVPSELALLTKLERLTLENNALTGTVPLELESLRVNGSLTTLTLANNSLSGSIPEALCSMGQYNSLVAAGLSFDCNALLCGCCWCPCPGSNYSNECETQPFLLNRDDEFPGAFPLPLNSSNVITINIRTDGYPEETSFEWSVQIESGGWKILESGNPTNANDIHNYTIEVASDSIYKLTIVDDIEFADGTCCGFGYGWFTITSSIPSDDYANGTLIWEAAGYELEHKLEVILSIDARGHPQLEEMIKLSSASSVTFQSP